jgi:hypothetical protein
MIEVKRDSPKVNPDADLHDFFMNLVAVMKENLHIICFHSVNFEINSLMPSSVRRTKI